MYMYTPVRCEHIGPIFSSGSTLTRCQRHHRPCPPTKRSFNVANREYLLLRRDLLPTSKDHKPGESPDMTNAVNDTV